MTWHNIKAINLRRSRSEQRPQRLVIMKKRKKAPSGNFMAAEASAGWVAKWLYSRFGCARTLRASGFIVYSLCQTTNLFFQGVPQPHRLFHHCVGMSTVALIPVYVCNIKRQHASLQPYFKILFVFALSCQCVRADLLP